MADTGAHQDRWSADSPGADDHLAIRIRLMKLTVPRENHTDSTTSRKHDPLDLRTRAHMQIPPQSRGPQIRLLCRTTPTPTLADLRQKRPLHVQAIAVLESR